MANTKLSTRALSKAFHIMSHGSSKAQRDFDAATIRFQRGITSKGMSGKEHARISKEGRKKFIRNAAKFRSKARRNRLINP